MRDNSHFEYVVIIVVGGGLVIAGALYGLFLFWPYLVFYVLPFTVGSLAVGALLRLAVMPGENGLMNYKGLAAAFPVLIVFVMVIFFTGPGRVVAVDENRNVTATYLDWPKVNKAFNRERSSTYAGAPFDGLKARARVPVIYDRQEIGWIALWCLFLGGPLFFWYLASGDAERDDREMRQKISDRSKYEREDLLKREHNVNTMIEKAAKRAEEKIAVIEEARIALLAENQMLKARVEFSDVPRPSESRRAGGVLDSDIL